MDQGADAVHEFQRVMIEMLVSTDVIKIVAVGNCFNREFS